jgi:hypothetical protein
MGKTPSPAQAQRQELIGVVRNGVIEFDGHLPEGTRVKVRPS